MTEQDGNVDSAVKSLSSNRWRVGGVSFGFFPSVHFDVRTASVHFENQSPLSVPFLFSGDCFARNGACQRASQGDGPNRACVGKKGPGIISRWAGLWDLHVGRAVSIQISVRPLADCSSLSCGRCTCFRRSSSRPLRIRCDLVVQNPENDLVHAAATTLSCPSL